MNQIQALNFFIAHDLLTATVSPEQRSRFINSLVVEKFDSEQKIYDQADLAGHLYMVVTGEVTLNQQPPKQPSHKREELCQTIKPGQYFGLEAGAFSKFYKATAIAQQVTTLIKIPGPILKLLMQENTAVAHNFLLFLTAEREGQIRSENALIHGPKDRMAYPFRIIFEWLLAIIFPTILYSTLNFFSVGQSLNIFCCTCLFGLLAWVLNLVPAYAASVFMLVAFLATGIVPPAVLLNGFGSESFIKLFCLYMLVSGMLTSGITHRVLLSALQYLPSNQWWMNMYIYILGLFYATIVPEVNKRHKLLAPTIGDLTRFSGLKSGSPAITRLIASSMAGASSFSAIFLHGSLYNFLLLGILWPQDQEMFQWTGWFEGAFIPGAFLFFIQFIIISLTCYNTPKLNIDQTHIRLQQTSYGDLTVSELIVLCAIPLLVIGLSTASFHRMTALPIYLFMLLIMIFMHPAQERSNKYPINWSSLLLFACLAGVLSASQYLGINNFIVKNLGWIGVYIKNNFMAFILLLALFSAILRLFLPYGPTVIILASILVPVAQACEVNSWLICFVCLTTAQIWFFPYQNPEYQYCKNNLIQTLQFNETIVLYHNALLNVVKVLALLISKHYWIKIGFL